MKKISERARWTQIGSFYTSDSANPVNTSRSFEKTLAAVSAVQKLGRVVRVEVQYGNLVFKARRGR